MTKIDIISGFLGAGKTTFIKKLLEEARRQADALVGEARQKAAQEGERLAAQAAARMDGAAALIVERIVGAT